MPHITLIHGIANKPSKDALHQQWIDAIADAGLSLDTNGIGSSIVYWADVMYTTPKPSASGHEASSADSGTEHSDEDMSWATSLDPEESRMVNALREKLGVDSPPPAGNDEFVAPATSGDHPTTQSPNGFEAIPLPWFIKRRLMKAFVRDAHHYMFNEVSEPRPDESYKVRDHIQQLFVEQLNQDASANPTGKHVVVAHSLGTVIAYDCLKNVAACPSIDAFFTVGSPLGLSEIQDGHDPAYSRLSAYPDATVRDSWTNYFDRLDPVALDASLANDYLSNGVQQIADIGVHNSGVWRHNANSYLSQPAFAEALRIALAV